MAVVSGRLIFCEGKPNSLDSALLNKLVEGVSGDKPTIVPSGGKFSFGKFAEGYFYRPTQETKSSAKKEEKTPPYIYIRDRDFDAVPTTDTPQLIELNKSFLTYRACIENYLLDAGLIHRYWQAKYEEKRQNPSSRWGHDSSPGIDEIDRWIESSARSLQSYQAVRWALGELIWNYTAHRELTTTWTGGSGVLPETMDLDRCKSEAVVLIQQFRQSVDEVSEEKFEFAFNQYQQRFAQDSFWDQKAYLVWFHGKDIQKEMQRQQSQYISLKKFYEWVTKSTTEIDFSLYPDLLELREKIEEL